MVITAEVTHRHVAVGRPFNRARFVIFATAGGVLLNAVIKAVVDRPRPAIVPLLMAEITSSLPSGQSMLSSIVYLTLGAVLANSERQRTVKNYLMSGAFVLTLLVGLSRIYLGVHYPTDVVADWCAGTAWASACLICFELRINNTTCEYAPFARHLRNTPILRAPNNSDAVSSPD